MSLFGALFTVDDVYHLDLDKPEANGYGIFAFKVPDIRSSDGSFLYDKCRIMLMNGVPDLNDIPKIRGTVVLGGSGFHLALSTVPEWVIDNHEALFQMEENRCLKTEEQFMIHLNRITNDPDRLFHTFLFVLPEGMAFTDDFTNVNASPSVMDLTQRIIMREVAVQKDIGGKPVSQLFFPGSFEMRVLHCNAASKELKSKSKDNSFSDFFSGMRTTQAPRKNQHAGMQGEQVDDVDM